MSIQIPLEYTPYRELVICSNKFINGQVLIEVKKSNVLILGRGEHPLVWMSTFTSPKSKVIVHLIENNKPLLKGFEVLLPINETVVSLNNNILLHVIQSSEDNAEIVEMDLRPIGLDIHGNNKGLLVGGSQLIENTFKDIPTMIAIGE